MKNIHKLFLVLFAAICCVSCNDEWKDEQYDQFASFKANINSQGVTDIYIRYKPEDKVIYDLPVVISGSTMNTQNRTIHVALDPDTLARLNQETFGHREELYFRQLTGEYYNMSETVYIPAGESVVTTPIEFTMGNLDQSEKWILPLQITNDPSYDYIANPHKHYRRALLRINPFNDFSGTYSGTLYKIFLAPDKDTPLTVPTVRTYVLNDSTIFLYAGLRDADYLDRKQYKIFIKFTDDMIDIQKKKLEIYTDNPQINLQVQGQAYYTIEEEMDPLKVYMKRIYVTLGLDYTFEDYTTVPGSVMTYTVTGTLAMQRNLNTLIPDEDQQIQW